MIGTRLFDLSFPDGSLSEKYNEYHVVNEDPGVAELADLVSIESDLSGAQVGCVLFEEESKRDPVDTGRLRVFFESTIISYARAFASGKGSGEKSPRRKIDHLVETLSEHDRATHDEVVRIRNQHVGHRVDQTSQAALIIAAFDRTTLKFKSISPVLVDKIDGQLIADLAVIVESLIALVGNAITAEIEQLTTNYASADVEGTLLRPKVLDNLGHD
jgi:hypothetical protein